MMFYLIKSITQYHGRRNHKSVWETVNRSSFSSLKIGFHSQINNISDYICAYLSVGAASPNCIRRVHDKTIWGEYMTKLYRRVHDKTAWGECMTKQHRERA